MTTLRSRITPIPLRRVTRRPEIAFTRGELNTERAAWLVFGVGIGALAMLFLTGCGADEGWRPVVLTPTTPELAALTERYVAEWTEATGLDVRTGPEGAPVIIVEPGMVTDSPNASAGTPMRGVDLTHVIRIELTEDARDITLKHEIGHALAQWPAEDGFSHAPKEARSLMSPGTPSELIDDAALEVVCRYAPCTRWVTEVAQ